MVITESLGSVISHVLHFHLIHSIVPAQEIVQRFGQYNFRVCRYSEHGMRQIMQHTDVNHHIHPIQIH